MKALKKLLCGIILAIVLFQLASCGKNKAEGAGTITIEVIDINDKLVNEKDVDFIEGDTLIKLVEENFDNVDITNDASPMIMAIETITTPKDWSTFISISVNGEMSMVGMKDIVLVDGMVVTFEETRSK